MTAPLIIRNVEIARRPGLSVRLEGGRIAEIGSMVSGGGETMDGRGGALIPGLTDHHIHLFALAAQANSVVLNGVANAVQLAERVRAGLVNRPPGAWLRVTGYHEAMAGELTQLELDALAPLHPIRVQHQTGALWMLNSLALERLGDHEALERDGEGRLTGRLWRGDLWLQSRLGHEPPDLAAIGRRLAAFGITGVTDASVTTDASAADRLAAAVRNGDLPLRLTLMSGGALEAPPDGAFAVGPLKILLDDHNLPDFDEMRARIADGRTWGRAIAVHCVTAGELALTLAAFDAAGAMPGDRIEHGGVIDESAIPMIRKLSLTVVTQSAFIRERGDRYLRDVAPREAPDLYRCASLLAAGVPLAGSSDAPYASPDPWLGMAAAIDRRTLGGTVLGEDERVTPEAALALYLSPSNRPGQGARVLRVCDPADLCLLATSLSAVLASPSSDMVRATLLGGALTYQA